MLFPLGQFESKDEVRAIANTLDMTIGGKSDSQEICFIPDDDYAGFVERNSDALNTPGNFVDTKGNVLGQHKGLIYYTVGQRKGLGISFGKPMFVVELKVKTNEIVLGSNEEVFAKGLIASQANFKLIKKKKDEL